MLLYATMLLMVTVSSAFKLSPITKPLVSRRGCTTLQMVDPVLIDSSYNLAAGCAVIGTVCGVLENFKGPTGKLFGGGAIAFTVFAAFIAFQTTTLRFQFDDTNFSLVKADGSSNGKNIVVGGENSWKYNTFVNYDFLPSEEFPILVYFKETQTPVENEQRNRYEPHYRTNNAPVFNENRQAIPLPQARHRPSAVVTPDSMSIESSRSKDKSVKSTVSARIPTKIAFPRPEF